MSFVAPSLVPIIPECVLLIMACATLMVSVFWPTKTREAGVYWTAQLSVLMTLSALIGLYPHTTQSVFEGMLVIDPLSAVLKLSMVLSVAVMGVYARQFVQDVKIPVGEFYSLVLFALLGMMVMVSASSLLTAFLGLELLSLPLYALVAIQRESAEGAEAAIKYFVMGSLASGILLYGFSLLYGISGSLDFTVVAHTIEQIGSHAGAVVPQIALVLVVVGMAFKLGMVPFHMWVPDVYEGAPTPVTLLLATAPKIATYGLLYRLLVMAMPSLAPHWQPLLMMLAVGSIAVGNVIAIVQTNFKRLLAYSSIAHMGYLLLGVLAATQIGYAASLFYVLTYALTSLVAFGMLLAFSSNGKPLAEITDFQGLNQRNPGLAFLLLVALFSMAGVPPVIGFMGKFGVLEALIQAHHVTLAVIAIAFAILGAYYYIQVIRVMYFEAPLDDAPVIPNLGMRPVLVTNGLAVLALGIFPGLLFQLCRTVV